MKNPETGGFAFCAVPHGTIISGLKGQNAKAVQLAATIKKNFEALAV